MLERLQALNPQLNIKSVDSTEFARYGRVLTDYDFSELIDTMKDFPVPTTTNTYIPEVEATRALPIHAKLSQQLYGEMPIQIGFGGGHCLALNALEWHKGNEVDIAITDWVVMLAQLQDIKDGQLHSKEVQTFYLKRGQAIEMFATTLHYSPCNVDNNVFKMIVILPKNTNLPLDHKPAKGDLLVAKNKWLIAHKDATSEVERGAHVGIVGENLTLKI
ncbi:MAG: DUF4867 family protein [Pseudomonadota bacterium]